MKKSLAILLLLLLVVGCGEKEQAQEPPEKDFQDLAGPDTEIAESIPDISPADQRKTIAAFEEKWGRISSIEYDPAGNVVLIETTIDAVYAAGGRKELLILSDAVLVDLKRLTGLNSLVIRSGRQGGHITDAGLKHLQGLTNLTNLLFPTGKITDAGLVHLKGLTQLERLTFFRSQIMGTGLVHLKGLTSLEYLDLTRTQVSDAGLEHLKGLENLGFLSLYKTQITDAGLEHLKGLTSLGNLTLLHTQVTDAGVADLRKALPDCQIEH